MFGEQGEHPAGRECGASAVQRQQDGTGSQLKPLLRHLGLQLCMALVRVCSHGHAPWAAPSLGAVHCGAGGAPARLQMTWHKSVVAASTHAPALAMTLTLTLTLTHDNKRQELHAMQTRQGAVLTLPGQAGSGPAALQLRMARVQRALRAHHAACQDNMGWP